MIQLQVFSLAALPFLAVPAWAQVSTSAILGQVLDSSSAAVANAELTAAQQETGFQRTVRSDGEGKYQFLYLPPGPYTITAQLAGFKLTQREGSLRDDIRASANVAWQFPRTTSPARNAVTRMPRVYS